jgi:hypothetical protein
VEAWFSTLMTPLGCAYVNLPGATRDPNGSTRSADIASLPLSRASVAAVGRTCCGAKTLSDQILWW